MPNPASIRARRYRYAGCCAVAVSFATAAPATAQGPNTLTAAERDAGWRLLFDGTSFAGWRGLGASGVPAEHWVVRDGAIEKVATKSVPKQADGRPVPGGDIMTEETFGDFELAWEWKVTPGANSGLKYNVSESLSTGLPETALPPAAGTPAAGRQAIGFEYQMLDDERHPDGRLVKHRTGDLYDLVAASEAKRVQPVGEWNQSRIVFRGPHGEHWLNGAKVVEYDLGTPAMTAAVAASKYKMPWFAERRRGHVVLQDHGDAVYVRSMRIRVLNAGGASSR